MRAFLLSIVPILLGLAGVAGAAPLTVKEVAFHVRTRMPEAELLRELAQRRLLAAPDAAAEKQLAASGASPTLLAHLRSGAYLLSPAQAQATVSRQNAQAQVLAQEAAADQARAEARNRTIAADANKMLARRTVQSWLKDQLVYSEGGTLREFDHAKINDTRVFAFYASASWCGPCRKFTPKLVAEYRALREKYPELEVIFVSSDRNEFNMGEYMRSHAMPWPALKYRQTPPQLAE
jgi:thiol-disulfide isomerase/thioredoxin